MVAHFYWVLDGIDIDIISLHVLHDLMLITPLQGVYFYYLHFTEEEPEHRVIK